MSGPCSLCGCPGFGKRQVEQTPPDPKNAIRATEEQIRYLHVLIDQRRIRGSKSEAHAALDAAAARGLTHDTAQKWIRKMSVRPERGD